MSFPYEGPSNELRLRVPPSTHQLEQMDNLPIKRPATVRKSRTVAPKATWQEREKAAKAKVKQAQGKADNIKRQSSPKLAKSNERLLKNTPAYKESQHPRDRFGRFAVKAIKSTVKRVGKAIKGTAKVVKSAHRMVKRVQTNGRKRAALEHRERKLDLHKREVAAGIGGKRRTPRKKATPAKKQGGLFGFLGGSQKKQKRRKK